LVDHFVQSFSNRLGKKIKRVDAEVMDLFMYYDWPGNVRELSNYIERAINLTRNGIITPDLLTKEILGEGGKKPISIWADTITKDNMEEEMIRTYMLKFNNNKMNVAKALNISRSSLYRKLEKYGIDMN
jgi:transcriptional regulator with PAS, ATPase and Fis domain